MERTGHILKKLIGSSTRMGSQGKPTFNPTLCDEQGLVAVGGNLSVELVLEAYASGVFPWPVEGLPMLWFSPRQRGVLFFKDLHVPSSLQKWIRKNCGKDQSHYRTTFCQATQEVINACKSAPRQGQDGTWITEEMCSVYGRLADLGHVLSVEVWNQKNELVGGIYGLKSKNYFSAESMFFRETNCSKLAFVEITKVLANRFGFSWMDIQMLTTVTRSFGACHIPQKQFLEMIGMTSN